MRESSRQTVVHRSAAAALVLGTAMSLTAVSGGIVPALADPATDTSGPTTVATAPRVTVIPEVSPTVVLEPQTQVTTTVAPVTTTAATPVATASPTSTSISVTSSSATTTSSASTSTATTQSTGTTTSGQTSTATTTPGSSTSSTTVQASQVNTTETPQRMDATAENIAIANASKPIDQNPAPASQSEIDSIKNMLDPANPSATATPSLAADAKSNVKQFQPDWVRYDDNYRPVIVNPYPEPLKVVYNYGGAPRIVVIPPLGSAITEVAQFGVYSFTAMVLNTVGAIVNVAVGCFNGGGYVPAPGQPPPLPPPPPVQYENIPVQVKYSNATYQPFVVQQIVDVGMDPAVGAEKVLLDGVTPAWGTWVQTEDGQRQFEVHKTQQFPGMDNPAEGPLPGDYQLQLASTNGPRRPASAPRICSSSVGRPWCCCWDLARSFSMSYWDGGIHATDASVPGALNLGIEIAAVRAGAGDRVMTTSGEEGDRVRRRAGHRVFQAHFALAGTAGLAVDLV